MKVAKITQTNPTPFTNGMQLGAKVLAKKSSQQISFRTNANNSPKVILLENVHGLPIDLVKPMCEMQQTKKFNYNSRCPIFCQFAKCFNSC
jgi:alanyl-tRNA synthetase